MSKAESMTSQKQMGYARMSSGDEVALRRTYDLCALGVVPRSFDQRAVR
jgi:hypothetical protein